MDSEPGIDASDVDALAAAEAVGLAFCPVFDHKGYCPMPWTTMVVRFEIWSRRTRHRGRGSTSSALWH